MTVKENILQTLSRQISISLCCFAVFGCALFPATVDEAKISHELLSDEFDFAPDLHTRGYASLIAECETINSDFKEALVAFKADELLQSHDHLKKVKFETHSECMALVHVLVSRIFIFQKNWTSATSSLRFVHKLQPRWSQEAFLLQMLVDVQTHIVDNRRLETVLYSQSARDSFLRAISQSKKARQSCEPFESVSVSRPKADVSVAVLLGAAVYSDGTPSARILLRLRHATQFLMGDPKMWLIASGAGNGSVSEAQFMENSLQNSFQNSAHLNSSNLQVIREERSRDTFENAVFSIPLALQVIRSKSFPYKLALITDQAHMERALSTFQELAFLKSSVPLEIEPQCAPIDGLIPPQGVERLKKEQDDPKRWFPLVRDLSRVHGLWLKPGVFH